MSRKKEERNLHLKVFFSHTNLSNTPCRIRTSDLTPATLTYKKVEVPFGLQPIGLAIKESLMLTKAEWENAQVGHFMLSKQHNFTTMNIDQIKLHIGGYNCHLHYLVDSFKKYITTNIIKTYRLWNFFFSTDVFSF
jgi:hypothetical protein